jgi:hypothetical protein
VIDIWGIGIYLEIGFWNLGFCPSLPWGKMYDIAQHVILPLQDAEFMAQGTMSNLCPVEAK